MNIENQLDGMCNTCRELAIDSDILNLYADNTIADRTISINCDHRHLCNAIKKNFEDIYSWVPVTKRLPLRPEYDWVLVRTDLFEGTGIPHVAELRNGVWYCRECDGPMEETFGLKVVAWFDMQLLGGKK